MKTAQLFLLALILVVGNVGSATAQDTIESANAIEEPAYVLLDDVVVRTRALKLPENRSRLQIIAANLLWKRDPARARSLLSDAAADIMELAQERRQDLNQPFGQRHAVAQLRQELLLTAARNDATLAYELFQKTRQQRSELQDGRVSEDEKYLEQLLLNQIIAKDPDFALRGGERPEHSQAIQQKINDTVKKGNSRTGFDQLTYLTQQGTSNNLLNAAAAAPSGMQNHLYQQAALKALDEGNIESARQIATNHLDPQMQRVVLNRIAAQAQLRKAKILQLEELRQALNETSFEHERVRLILQLAQDTKVDNPTYSRQVLDEACGLVTRRAMNYKHLEDKLQVAHVLSTTDSARSFEVLESGINQLNELLPAAALLSGFEVQIFIQGEMPLPGNSELGAVVVRYGEELGTLAKSDFRRASSTAEQLQYPEARLFVQLSIVKAVLESE